MRNKNNKQGGEWETEKPENKHETHGSKQKQRYDRGIWLQVHRKKNIQNNNR